MKLIPVVATRIPDEIQQQIGTSCPLRLRVMPPDATRAWHQKKAITTTA